VAANDAESRAGVEYVAWRDGYRSMCHAILGRSLKTILYLVPLEPNRYRQAPSPLTSRLARLYWSTGEVDRAGVKGSQVQILSGTLSGTLSGHLSGTCAAVRLVRSQAWRTRGI
jgi:hypothetical protein